MIERIAFNLFYDIIPLIGEVLLHLAHFIFIYYNLRGVQTLWLLKFKVDFLSWIVFRCFADYDFVQACEVVCLFAYFLGCLGFLLLFEFFFVFIVDTVVEVSVVVEHVLTIYFFAFVAEGEGCLGDQDLLNAIVLVEIVRNVTFGGVEGR